MRWYALAVVATAAAAMSIAPGAPAATWCVARDGSQPFADVQAALDFSAPGDTVLLYPGRYDIGRWVPAPGGAAWLLGRIEHDDLVLRGTNPFQVVLGPAAPAEPAPSGYGLLLASGTRGQRIENLTIENLGLAMEAKGDVTVRDVTIRRCHGGIVLRDATDAVVQDCTFDGVPEAVSAWSSERIWVKDCTFSGQTGGVFVHSVLGWARIERCNMLGVSWGISGQAGSVLEVIDTAIRASGAGIWVTGGATRLTLNRSGIDGGEFALWATGGSSVSGSHNVFQAGSYATLVFEARAQAQLVENHIFLQAQQSVRTRNYGSADPTVYLDLTRNYWGGASDGQVAARIWDGHDDPTIHAFVEFLPTSGGPVPARTVSFGQLKAGFTEQ